MYVKFNKVNDVLDDAIWAETIKNTKLPAGSGSWSTNFEGVINHLNFICPCGCQDVITIPVNQAEGSSWKWDGNLELPTLTPSILRKSGCRWHGFLTKGEFKIA